MSAIAASTQVLVVEDNFEIREVLKEILEVEGLDVLTASNGLEGLAAIQSTERPCFILLDLMMPVMNGYQFLDALVQRPDLYRFGVLVVSAELRPHQGLACMPGVLGCMSKPFELDDVLGAIQRFHPEMQTQPAVNQAC